MNIHTPEITAIPERDEAEAALDLLRLWDKAASSTEILELDFDPVQMLDEVDSKEGKTLC